MQIKTIKKEEEQRVNVKLSRNSWFSRLNRWDKKKGEIQAELDTVHYIRI